MGAKFANINIYGDNFDHIKKVVRYYKIKNLFKGPINLILSMFSSYYLGQQNDKWITLLNESFGYESVQDIAIDLSHYINHPILTVGYFDDDFLKITLIQRGDVITRFIQGEGLDVYGLEEVEIDVEKLCQLLDLEDKKDEIEKIFKIKNIEELLFKFQDILQIQLWLSTNWLTNLNFIFKKI